MTNIPGPASDWGHHFHGLEQLDQLNDVVTDQVADIRLRLAEAVRDRNVMMVTGKPGTGKTFATGRAVDHALTVFDGLSVVWLEMATAIHGKALALNLFAQISGQEPHRSITLRELSPMMRAELAGTWRAIVLDEAQHAHVDAMQMLRWLHERGDANFALVIVGTPLLESRIPYELSSRIMSHVRVGVIDDDEAPGLLADYHPLFAGVDPALLRRLNCGEARGEFRWWAKFLLRAHHYLPQVGGVLDAETAEIICTQMRRGGRK